MPSTVSGATSTLATLPAIDEIPVPLEPPSAPHAARDRQQGQWGPLCRLHGRRSFFPRPVLPASSLPSRRDARTRFFSLSRVVRRARAARSLEVIDTDSGGVALAALRARIGDRDRSPRGVDRHSSRTTHPACAWQAHSGERVRSDVVVEHPLQETASPSSAKMFLGAWSRSARRDPRRASGASRGLPAAGRSWSPRERRDLPRRAEPLRSGGARPGRRAASDRR